MRLLLKYIKQRLVLYAVFVFFGIIFGVSFLLYRLPIEAVIYPFIVCLSVGLVLSVADFINVKRKHEALASIKSMTEVKDRILPRSWSVESDDYKEILRLLGEEHTEYLTNTSREYSQMVDYYTVWAHQIKTPIASMRLHLQNEDTPTSRQLYADLCRIEQYVEMVLTFLRLNSDSSDYVIKEYDLDGIVKGALKKFSHEFIDKRISLVYEPLNTRAVTDEKWLSFVIEQILSNALKYTKNGSITISVDDRKRLSIADTGIGIAPEDLPRIFENGYTGLNGRSDKKASGIGLYLCRRICTNLGCDICIGSVVDKGTTVILDLSQKKMMLE